MLLNQINNESKPDLRQIVMPPIAPVAQPVQKEEDQVVNDAKVARAIAANKRKGYSRSFVKEIQTLVKADPDGWIGRETVTKIMEWQRDNGLEDDGIFGPASRSASGLNMETHQAAQKAASAESAEQAKNTASTESAEQAKNTAATESAEQAKNVAPPKSTEPALSGTGDILISTTAYAQGDPRWKGDRLGKDKTIGSDGCAMTSSTMALNGLTGQNRTPQEVNAYLKSHKGYDGNLLDWSKIAGYYGRSSSAASMSVSNVVRQLKAGKPSVISVKGKGHWVCVVGFRASDNSFIILDPAGGKTLIGKWNKGTIRVGSYAPGFRLQIFD